MKPAKGLGDAALKRIASLRKDAQEDVASSPRQSINIADMTDPDEVWQAIQGIQEDIYDYMNLSPGMETPTIKKLKKNLSLLREKWNELVPDENAEEEEWPETLIEPPNPEPGVDW